MKVITIYQANDGTQHDTELGCKTHESNLAGRPHECPKCKGSGFVNGAPITRRERDELAEGYAGFHSGPQYKEVITGYEKKRCDACGGHGFTSKQLTPIIETKITGYQ